MDGSEYANIENHHVALKYANMLSLLAQQTTSKLESCVQVKGGLRGNTVSPADQIGKFSTDTREGRFEDTPIKDISRTRRWYEPVMKHGAALFDSWDEIRMDLKPEDGVVQSMLAAYHRDIDAEIVRAYFADNKTGKGAADTTAFDTNMTVAADYKDGDILAKIDCAIKFLQEKDVDIEAEELYCIVSPALEEKLKENGIYISNDYMDGKVLAGKKLSSYAGVNFVRYNLAGTTSGSATTYNCPLFCKSGVALGKWEDCSVKFSERNDLSHAKQVYMEYAIGATRLEEAKCASILITA